MAGEIALVVVLLWTTGLFHIESCSPFYVEIRSETVSELHPEDVTITCSTSNNVTAIDLGKMGEEPIVSLQQTKFKYGGDMRSYMQTDGKINLDNSPKSVLSLTITNPTLQDSGIYECCMHYKDSFERDGKDEANARASVDTKNTKNIVQFVLNKVSSMESLLQQHKAKALLQQKEIDEQTEKTKELKLKSQLVNLIDEMKTVTNETMDQKNVNAIEQMEAEIRNKSAQLSKNLSNLPASLTLQRVQSAFMATVNDNNHNYSCGIFVLPHVKLNVGYDYSRYSGMYTAPAHGIYVFYLLALTDRGGPSLVAEIRVEKETLAATFVYDGLLHAQSSTIVTCELQQGDQVYAFVKSMPSVPMRIEAFPYTSFSGYLIYTL